jgi:hypothetical protein
VPLLRLLLLVLVLLPLLQLLLVLVLLPPLVGLLLLLRQALSMGQCGVGIVPIQRLALAVWMTMLGSWVEI